VGERQEADECRRHRQATSLRVKGGRDLSYYRGERIAQDVAVACASC
jgi:hypothetical protein